MTAASAIEPVKKLEVKQALELATFFHLPQTLANTYAVQFGDSIYYKPRIMERREEVRRSISPTQLKPVSLSEEEEAQDG